MEVYGAFEVTVGALGDQTQGLCVLGAHSTTELQYPTQEH